MLDYGFSATREVHYTLDENLMVLKAPAPVRAFHIRGEDREEAVGTANRGAFRVFYLVFIFRCG
jgi:hypothetical protein